jgi:hypothetical protein
MYALTDPSYLESYLMVWYGRKALFMCDKCEKCDSRDISQIRFKGDDGFDIHDIHMDNSYLLPITGKILMRCSNHRIKENSVEIDTVYRPNFTEVNYGWERRMIPAPPIAETVISHNPQRDSILFDNNDFVWHRIK